MTSKIEKELENWHYDPLHYSCLVEIGVKLLPDEEAYSYAFFKYSNPPSLSYALYTLSRLANSWSTSAGVNVFAPCVYKYLITPMHLRAISKSKSAGVKSGYSKKRSGLWINAPTIARCAAVSDKTN